MLSSQFVKTCDWSFKKHISINFYENGIWKSLVPSRLKHETRGAWNFLKFKTAGLKTLTGSQREYKTN